MGSFGGRQLLHHQRLVPGWQLKSCGHLATAHCPSCRTFIFFFSNKNKKDRLERNLCELGFFFETTDCHPSALNLMRVLTRQSAPT